MRIAVIGAKGLPPKQGGIEHHCAEIYPRLVEKGLEVDLYARSSYVKTLWGDNYSYQGVRVVSLPCPGVKGFDAFLSAAMGALACSGKRYDIIHFHALGPSLFTWLPRLTTRSKIVVTCHGLDWQRAKWGKLSSRMIRLGEKAAVRFSHRMIVVSQDLQDYFLETYNKDTTYIANAPAKYAASDPNFSYGASLGLKPGRYIVFLGRLVPEKCPDLLIEAFQRLQRDNWKMVIVGGTSDTSPYSDALFHRVANNPNIIFTGELHGGRLAEIVRSARLFVLPSKLEGLPLALLEAMREGVPVMTSDIPVHQQLLGSDRGVLFRTGSLEDCHTQLEWALNHPSQMAEMANNARRYIRSNYNWDQITANCLDLYHQLVAPSSPVGSKARLRLPT
jgi:glycosyltransferase involved in cell wall biosynthesis